MDENLIEFAHRTSLRLFLTSIQSRIAYQSLAMNENLIEFARETGTLSEISTSTRFKIFEQGVLRPPLASRPSHLIHETGTLSSHIPVSNSNTEAKRLQSSLGSSRLRT